MPSVTIGPCEGCCGSDGGCLLQCRAWGGTATLVGFSEFTSPSVPPKKYLRATLSGEVQQVRYVGVRPGVGPCEVSTGVVVTEIGRGSAQYNASTGTCVSSMALERIGDALSWPGTYPQACGNGGIHMACANSNPAMTCLRTQTVREWLGNGSCGTILHPNQIHDFAYIASGAHTLTLSDEDTEDAAAQRVPPPNVHLWPESDCATTTSFRTVRGAGQFTFSFRSVQVRAAVTSPVPGAIYNITIYTRERPLGVGGPWSDPAQYAVVQVQASENADEIEWSDWVSLPTEAGTEILATHCTVEVLS